MLDLGRRVVVAGPSGSGKSSVADRLARWLGVPVVDLDALHHEPGWRAPPLEVFRWRVLAALLAPEARGGWVVAGNYSAVRDLTWGGAETIVWLDFPLHVTLPRVLIRSWRRSRSPRLLWGTNRERFLPQLKLWSTESLVHWNIRRHWPRRRFHLAAMEDPTWRHLRFIRLRNQRAVDALLADLGVPPAPRE